MGDLGKVKYERFGGGGGGEEEEKMTMGDLGDCEIWEIWKKSEIWEI